MIFEMIKSTASWFYSSKLQGYFYISK